MSSPLRRSHRKRVLDLPQYLIVGDENSLTQVEWGIATLPLCASGRIFIEVERSEQIVHLDVPARMVVTWLVRQHPHITSAAGDKTARAVSAWASEMICDDAPRVQAWLMGDDNLVSRLRDTLSRNCTSEIAIMSGSVFSL
ncbi:SIP domain-containing protein [Lysinibacter sp. HNR]|uniref:SIP domain-containing protein n=1 Tax=Lysinibacter sp. HNR TaxID=3031408 RepID=UPI002434EBBE|nr:SIP domain-containing protein [Lysinibacter sp. HNR]WGD36896.1 SIP domain-containing protein [Lysinibacter sp. HNR]